MGESPANIEHFRPSRALLQSPVWRGLSQQLQEASQRMVREAPDVLEMPGGLATGEAV
jgi:hypothetical protein